MLHSFGSVPVLAERRLPLLPGGVNQRVLAERRTVHIPDTGEASFASEFPGSHHATMGVRALLATPLVRDNVAVGLIQLRRADPRPFTGKQIELLETFADQAVIAIENVRLFNETKEALERQTATAEILRVISGSITDTQPVFDAIVDSCQRLFNGRTVVLVLPDGRMLEAAATAFDNVTETESSPHLAPWPFDRGSGAGACILDSRVIALSDISEAVTTYPRAKQLALALGYRSGLFVPLMREARAIGCLAILRGPTGEFSDKEISLASTFADQAVIAIENVRLFNETKEALDRQTATAEILRVISGSVTDTQPVFDAIVRSCQRLFGGMAVNLALPSGTMLERVAVARDETLTFEQARRWPLDRLSVSGECVLASKVMVVPNRDDVLEQFPRTRELASWRSALFVPLLREGKAIGCIGIGRATTGGFGDKEISLAQTFADQAVIAIENVRLFNETKEALEQQTAISEILRVISALRTEVKPVLDAIAERAARLCDASAASIYLSEGDTLRHVASKGSLTDPHAFIELLPISRESIAGRAMLERTTIHVHDLLAEAAEYPVGYELGQRFGHRTMRRHAVVSRRAAVRHDRAAPAGSAAVQRTRSGAGCGPSATRRRSRSRTCGCSGRSRTRAGSSKSPTSTSRSSSPTCRTSCARRSTRSSASPKC